MRRWAYCRVHSRFAASSVTDLRLAAGFIVTVQCQSPKESDDSSVESCEVNVNGRNLPNTEVADLEVSLMNKPQRYEWIVL